MNYGVLKIFNTKTKETAKAVRLDRLRLPIHICLGHYEAATTEELHALLTDITHEISRRPE